MPGLGDRITHVLFPFDGRNISGRELGTFLTRFNNHRVFKLAETHVLDHFPTVSTTRIMNPHYISLQCAINQLNVFISLKCTLRGWAVTPLSVDKLNRWKNRIFYWGPTLKDLFLSKPVVQHRGQKASHSSLCTTEANVWVTRISLP